MNQMWIRIEGTTKEDFTKFVKNHSDLVQLDLERSIYDFGSGIVVCVDLKELIEKYRLPEVFYPDNYGMLLGGVFHGESHIRLRLSSGIGVNHALEV